MIPQNLKVIIFDFDGVIVESNGLKDRVFEEIFNRFPGHAAEALQYHRKNISLSRYAKFDFLLEQMGRKDDAEFKKELVDEFSKVTLNIMKKVAFVEGAKAFLETYHSKLPLYLASVTPAEDLSLIIDDLGLRKFFKEIYGCPPWTKPRAILDILEKENLSTKEAVLIGDSYGDQRAANETGIHFIGRNSGLGFEDPQPDLVVKDMDHLSQLLHN